jgi:DNA-binding MarR family transcriptional regulator
VIDVIMDRLYHKRLGQRNILVYMLRPHAAVRRYPGFLMLWIGRNSSARFAKALAPLNLAPPQFGLLNVLQASEPMSQHELGKSLGIDPSTMVALIDELESRGFVERRRRPEDRRAHSVHLTDEGRAVLARGRRVAARMQEKLLARLDPAEREELTRLLGKVVDELDEAGG